MFAREWVADLRRARERYPDLPRVVLVHQGTPAQGDVLTESLWPDAPSVSDPRGELFRGFGLRRGSPLRLIGPSTWFAAVRAFFKGHFIGLPVGDPLVMPGLFLVHGERLLWSATFEHVGDQPSAESMAEAARVTLDRSAGRAG